MVLTCPRPDDCQGRRSGVIEEMWMAGDVFETLEACEAAKQRPREALDTQNADLARTRRGTERYQQFRQQLVCRLQGMKPWH
jgi:hypothetical protein